MAESTASPCIRNCCLDERNICLGCGRTLDEIRDWSKLSDAEKCAVNERARIRHTITERRFSSGA